MKKLVIVTMLLLGTAVAIISCDSKRRPGKIYVPDMTYSRAYETYAPRDSMHFTEDVLAKGGKRIFYNNVPPAGTIKRGELFAYPLPNDSNGYIMSASVKNPLTDSLGAADLAETSRLYNINCGICHGEKAAGNGPLSTSGKIGGVANLMLPNYISMADGTMFHSIQYGKGIMGSYASQLSRKQRWMIVKYIRKLQGGGAAAPPVDSTATAKKI